MRCSNCGALLEDGVRFCRECGSRVETTRKRFCRECGTPVPEGNKFCPSCGAALMLNDASEVGDQNGSADDVETGNPDMDEWQEWTPAAQPKSRRRQKQKSYSSANSFAERSSSKNETLITIMAFVLAGLSLLFLFFLVIIQEKDSKIEIDDEPDQVISDVQNSASPAIESQEERQASVPTPTSAPIPSPTPNPTPEATKKPALSYTTNDRDTAKKGNSGVFSYRSRGGSYQIYYIIDFDEGYVYTFTDRNGSNTCDRLKIEEGDLNTVLIVTYHDGGDVWSNGLHFKYKNMPDQLVMEDNDGFKYEYVTTNLEDALALRNQKTITDYST